MPRPVFHHETPDDNNHIKTILTYEKQMEEKEILKEKKELGERMKHFRLQRGFTSIEKFAFTHDISRILYSNWEAGRGNITYKNLLKLIKAYNTDLAEFFSRVIKSEI